MSKLKVEVIKYSKKLTITNLSALRSGNISVRAKEKGVEGFYITPSGRKYSSLKTKDIVFVSLKGIYDKNIYASAQEAYNGITDIMSEENFITPVDGAKQKAEFGQSELYNMTKIRLSMLDEQLFNEEINKDEYREKQIVTYH